MSVAPWDLGRLRQFYIKDMTAFGTVPTLGATNAMRVRSVVMHYDPQALTPSQERHATPGQRALFRRRAKASIDIEALLYPSGTLNTLPEANTALKNAFGQAPTNITLSTTVSSGAGVSGAVVASATGLAARQAIQIGVLGGSAPGVYVRHLTAAYAGGTTLTWEPPLPATCAVSDTVKGGVTYVPATAPVPTSMDGAYYPNSFTNREMADILADKLSIMLDSNSEPIIKISGPASRLVAAPQSQPGSFTTVGAENAIPSGLYGYFYYGGTLYEVEKVTFDLTNNFDVQNSALGTAYANAALRKGKREVMITVDAKVSNDLTLWTPSIAPGPTAPTENTLMVQIGLTSGQIWGFFCPRVLILQAPDVPDGDETNNYSFKMQALETSGNDEFYVSQV